MVNIQLNIVSSNENFLIGEKQVSIIDESRFDVSVNYIKNNKRPLATVINGLLISERKDRKNDLIVFMHGDVDLDLNSFLNHISSVVDKYDVIGLAGTKKMNTSESPLNWFTSSNRTPESRYGDVTMFDGQNERRCFYNEYSDPMTTDTRVACIDGLCIAFGKNAIESNFELFEDISEFDFYDTQVSLDCLIRYKLRLGVIVEPVVHKSVGRGILTDRFLEDEIKFRAKYGLKIPEGKRISQIIS